MFHANGPTQRALVKSAQFVIYALFELHFLEANT